MGEEEDPQKIKRIAAAAYDYENDPQWADYWSNILIPPHMASRSDVVSHFKRKFYQRFIDPELVVEAMSTTSSSQPARSSAAPSSTSNDRAQPRNSGSATGAARASTAPPQNPTSLRWDRQTIQFSVNAWVLVVAVLSMIPLVPRSLSNRAYRLSFLGTACSSLYSLYALYGKPRAWNLQAVQVWFQSVIATKDFIYFIYCLTFVTSNLYLKFALLPVLCRVLEHVAKFVRRNFSRSSLYSTPRVNIIRRPTIISAATHPCPSSARCTIFSSASGFAPIARAVIEAPGPSTTPSSPVTSHSLSPPNPISNLILNQI